MENLKGGGEWEKEHETASNMRHSRTVNLGNFRGAMYEYMDKSGEFLFFFALFSGEEGEAASVA